MRVLVTGGAGYIGSHFLKELREQNYNEKDILIIDNFENSCKENIIFGRVIKADIRDKEKVEEIISKFKPDLIVHFVAFISVPESVREPVKYYENNFVGSLNLINAAIKNKVNKFIFSSTSAVYGTPKKIPVSEDSRLKPVNPYGNSKKMVEELLKDVKIANPNFNYIVLRYFNVAGSDPDLEVGDTKKPINLIGTLLKKVLKGKKEIDIYGNDYNTPDGTGVRDYIHVTDLARAHISVITKIQKGSFIFNVGYGKGFSVLDIVKTVEKVLKKKIKINLTKRRIGDIDISVADNTKILKETDWKPKYADLNIIIKTAWEWRKKIK